MKASREWLEEYADIDVETNKLGDILTMIGQKVETIEEVGKDIENVVIGKIIEIKKHEDSDHLLITKVDVGTEKIQIVTGASNIKLGDIIPIAKDGAKLPGGKEIKKGSLRGVESAGMMCSVQELGIEVNEYPNQIEDGIMILERKDEIKVLPEVNLEEKLGENIVDTLKLREDIIEFEITPNRPDCLGIEGLGRETAVGLSKEFKNPRKNLEEIGKKVENKEEIEGLRVDIKDDLCYRYIARVAKNIKIGPSPKWLVRRLKACGVRSINNIVDITNYVMLELGQPMHAFDLDKIEEKHIEVRKAKKGEKITTLDKEERILDEKDLVIADKQKALAIAGVIGGMDSEVTEETKNIVFESATFYGGAIRNTAKRQGIRTESSTRFEKGLSPENALRAINRAIELVEMLKIGEEVEGKIDIYNKKQEERSIKLEEEKINSLLGTNLTKEEMIKTLESLEIKVEEDIVKPPYFRQDIEGRADLAEEIVRVYGYDKLATTFLTAETTIGIRTKEQKIEDKILETLQNSGMSEIYTYGFINEKELDKAHISEELKNLSICIMNPLNDDYKYMRPTTIPSMLSTILTNINNKNNEAYLFDISRRYQNIGNEIEKGEVPQEEKILTLGMYGKNVDFYRIKGYIENILEQIGVVSYDIEKEKENKSYHPGRCANLKVGNDIIVTLGEVHPEVLQNYGIKQRIYIAELNITKVTKYAKEVKKYKEIAKFPAVERDLAIIVDEEIEVGKIEKTIIKIGKKLLESIELFDIYRDEKIGENKKSIAYALKFRDKNKTLQDEEINPIMEKIVKELKNEYGAELRK